MPVRAGDVKAGARIFNKKNRNFICKVLKTPKASSQEEIEDLPIKVISYGASKKKKPGVSLSTVPIKIRHTSSIEEPCQVTVTAKSAAKSAAECRTENAAECADKCLAKSTAECASKSTAECAAKKAAECAAKCAAEWAAKSAAKCAIKSAAKSSDTEGSEVAAESIAVKSIDSEITAAKNVAAERAAESAATESVAATQSVAAPESVAAIESAAAKSTEVPKLPQGDKMSSLEKSKGQKCASSKPESPEVMKLRSTKKNQRLGPEEKIMRLLMSKRSLVVRPTVRPQDEMHLDLDRPPPSCTSGTGREEMSRPRR